MGVIRAELAVQTEPQHGNGVRQSIRPPMDPGFLPSLLRSYGRRVAGVTDILTGMMA